MEKNTKITFIGAGHLASSIIGALMGVLGFCGQDITIFDKIVGQYKNFEALELKNALDVIDALNSGDIIFLTVRPGDFLELLADIKKSGLDLTKKLFVSTAAGITTEYIEENIGQEIAVIRTMPNTPISIGKGMTALCKNQNVSEKDFKMVCDIFSSLGEIIVLPEDKMNKIVAVNGSSPAYVYLFAEAMLAGARDLGFGEEQIYPAVLQSLIGAFEMLKESKKSPAELIAAVAVPGGTTLKALESFYADDFAGAVKRAMQACAVRADEMTKQYCGEI
jgi:pyrroline-5-carboxylate reductase